MKTPGLPLIIAAFFSLLAASAPADTFQAGSVTFSGTIKMNSGSNTTVSEALTIPNLLKLFGQKASLASQTKILTDLTTNSYVLASADHNTIYGTIFTWGSSGNVSWYTSGKASGNYTGADTCMMLDGYLVGTVTYSSFTQDGKVHSPASFIAFGTYNSTATYIKGSLLQLTPNF
ncbi:MAG: hypothetical protein QM796_20940 [Chthoniobacteraceae bacterium]